MSTWSFSFSLSPCPPELNLFLLILSHELSLSQLLSITSGFLSFICPPEPSPSHVFHVRINLLFLIFSGPRMSNFTLSFSLSPCLSELSPFHLFLLTSLCPPEPSPSRFPYVCLNLLILTFSGSICEHSPHILDGCLHILILILFWASPYFTFLSHLLMVTWTSLSHWCHFHLYRLFFHFFNTQRFEHSFCLTFPVSIWTCSFLPSLRHPKSLPEPSLSHLLYVYRTEPSLSHFPRVHLLFLLLTFSKSMWSCTLPLSLCPSEPSSSHLFWPTLTFSFSRSLFLSEPSSSQFSVTSWTFCYLSSPCPLGPSPSQCPPRTSPSHLLHVHLDLLCLVEALALGALGSLQVVAERLQLLLIFLPLLFQAVHLLRAGWKTCSRCSTEGVQYRSVYRFIYGMYVCSRKDRYI